MSDLEMKEKVLVVLFCFTCFQLVTKIPNITLIPGERTKVFSGLLCGITFIILLVVKKETLRINREWIICFILALLCLLSGLTSGDPSSSLWRGITFIFSAAGGFWCGKLLLDTPFHRALFAKLCLVLLGFLLLLGIVGYFVYGNVLYLANIHKHPFNCLILLLSFGPLWLLYGGKRWMSLLGILYLLAGTYVISRSFDPMIWFPPLLLFGAMLITVKKKKYVVVPVLLVFLLVSLFQAYKLPKYFFTKESISIWVRVENVFFSYHMVKKKPLLGIGLVAPRIEYLDDYDIVYPYLSKEKFAAVIPDENRSSENQFLTFMCDLGIPFLLLYSFAVLFLYIKFLKNMRRRRKKEEMNPIIVWIPITGALFHLMFFDGLLQPQVCWFFHIFLGMISVNNVEFAEKRVLFRTNQDEPYMLCEQE